MAITNDKNSKDWDTKEENNSFGTNTPTKRLLEKSGNGNIKNPPIKPIKIERYAVFSFTLL